MCIRDRGNPDLMGFSKQDYQAENQRNKLSDHRRDGRPSDAHGWNTEIAKNENRVQYDVCDRPGELEQHGIDHVSRGLEGLFYQDVYKRQLIRWVLILYLVYEVS